MSIGDNSVELPEPGGAGVAVLCCEHIPSKARNEVAGNCQSACFCLGTHNYTLLIVACLLDSEFHEAARVCLIVLTEDDVFGVAWCKDRLQQSAQTSNRFPLTRDRASNCLQRPGICGILWTTEQRSTNQQTVTLEAISSRSERASRRVTLKEAMQRPQRCHCDG